MNALNRLAQQPTAALPQVMVHSMRQDGCRSAHSARLQCLLVVTDPAGKRIANTTDWPHSLRREWPKHRPTVAKKFPGHVWR